MTFDPDAMPPLMTVNETALALNGMALSTVRMLCTEGRIMAFKIGRRWLVNRNALYRQYGIESRHTKEEAPAEADQSLAEAT